MVLTSVGHHLDLDTEDVEGYNSLIKHQSRQAPSISAELLSSRVNMKADMGHCCAADHNRPIRELMAVGSKMHHQLEHFATKPKAIQGVISAKGRWAHAPPVLDLPTEAEVDAAMKVVDPIAFADLKHDPEWNWSAAHNSLLHAMLKPHKSFTRMVFIGKLEPGTRVYLRADSCLSIHFLVEWVVRDGRLQLVLPFKCVSSIDLFKERFKHVHSEAYEEVITVNEMEIDWSSWRIGDNTARMSFSCPASDDATIKPILDLRPGRKYAKSEKTRRLCSDKVEDEIEKGSEQALRDLRESFSSGSSMGEADTLESELTRIMEEEQADIGEAEVDKREDCWGAKQRKARDPVHGP